MKSLPTIDSHDKLIYCYSNNNIGFSFDKTVNQISHFVFSALDNLNNSDNSDDQEPHFEVVTSQEDLKKISRIIAPLFKQVDYLPKESPPTNKTIRILRTALMIGCKAPIYLSTLQKHSLMQKYEQIIVSTPPSNPSAKEINSFFEFIQFQNFVSSFQYEPLNSQIKAYCSNLLSNNKVIRNLVERLVKKSDKIHLKAFLKVISQAYLLSKHASVINYLNWLLDENNTNGIDFLLHFESILHDKTKEHLFSPLLDFLSYFSNKQPLSLSHPLLHQKFLFFEITCPFIECFGSKMAVDRIKSMESLDQLFELSKTYVSGLEHQYVSSHNAHTKVTISFFAFLQRGNILNQLCWQGTLSIKELYDRIQLLRSLARHLTTDRLSIHSNANTLKALCWFIPRANRDFTLGEKSTLENVVQIMEKKPAKEEWDKALLFFDIYPPSEAKTLYEFYLKHAKSNCRISKVEFKLLSKEEQYEWLFYLSRQRTRQTDIAKFVLKHFRHEEKFCLLSLEWLSAVHKQISINDREKLFMLISPIYSLPIRQAAIKAIWSTSLNVNDKKARDLIILEILKFQSLIISTKQTTQYIGVLLETLSNFHFSEKDDCRFLELFYNMSKQLGVINSKELSQSFAISFLKIVARGEAIKRTDLLEPLPFTQLLLRAKEIVESEAWSDYDKDYKLDASFMHFEEDPEVPHLKYPICQEFEFRNRHRVLVGILDLLTELDEGLLKDAQKAQDQSVLRTKYEILYLEKIPKSAYYVPFVNIPPNEYVFRAIGNKQGEHICQAAVIETLMMGCFVRDVLLAAHNTGNWSKRKQEYSGSFFTTSFEVAQDQLYYHKENGALLVMNSNKINQDRLALQLRVEKESQFNFLAFNGKSRYEFDLIILHPSWQTDLLHIAGKTPEMSKLANSVQMYDMEQPNSKAKKDLKTNLLKQINELKKILMVEGNKAIFQGMNAQQLLELHRHLVQDNFLSYHVIFTDNPKKIIEGKKKSKSTLNTSTEERLSLMHFMRKEYYKKFQVPFCFGQDEILGLPSECYIDKIPALLSMLTTFEKLLTAQGIPQSNSQRKNEIIGFERSLQKFNLGKNDNFRPFRLAFLFRDFSLELLEKAITHPDYQNFFGFEGSFVKSPQIVISLIKLYKRSRTEKNSDSLKQLLTDWCQNIEMAGLELPASTKLIDIIEIFIKQ